MTWRRWLLMGQVTVAFYLLSALFFQILGGNHRLPVSDVLSFTIIAYSIIFGILLASVIAPFGIFKQRAWGYFLELPVLVLVIWLWANVGSKRKRSGSDLRDQGAVPLLVLAVGGPAGGLAVRTKRATTRFGRLATTSRNAGGLKMDKRRRSMLIAAGYVLAALGTGITLYMSWANQGR
jgi:hypothetical protein